jgi:hypothetical protein
MMHITTMPLQSGRKKREKKIRTDTTATFIGWGESSPSDAGKRND